MENKNIAFLGPGSSFTHEAALKYFKTGNNFLPLNTIEDVFRKVINDEADFGVVPAENSIGGTIVDTIDLFVKTDLKIYDQVSLEIRQNIMSKSEKSDIRKIYSHSNSFHQCAKYLFENFPKVEYIETTSNAKAALIAAKEPDAAAIGPLLCAQEYGLEVLEKNINDFQHNETKFFIIAKIQSEQIKYKSMIIFSVPNKPGSLYDVLKIFKKNGVNMTRIESRPSRIRKWDYVFIIEYDNTKDLNKEKKLIDTMKRSCQYFNYLGSY